VLGQVGLEDIRPLVRQQHRFRCEWPEIRMKVGSPCAGKKHLPFEHDAVDTAAALPPLICVVLFRVGHRSKENGDPPFAGSFDEPPEVRDDIVFLDRSFGQVPRGAPLGEEIVDGIDDEQRRALRGKCGVHVSAPRNIRAHACRIG